MGPSWSDGGSARSGSSRIRRSGRDDQQRFRALWYDIAGSISAVEDETEPHPVRSCGLIARE
jgi:hypothetical protein